MQSSTKKLHAGRSLAASILALTVLGASTPSLAAAPAQSSVTAAQLPGFAVLEQDTQLEREAARDRVRRADTDLPRRVIRRSLWTSGIAGALALGFGVTGEVISRRMQSGYEEGMTLNDYDRRVGWGKASNGIAIGSLLVSAAGLVTAAVMYTIEYNHCGPVAAGSHRCRVLKQSQRSEGSWQADKAPPPQVHQDATNTRANNRGQATQAPAEKAQTRAPAPELPRDASKPGQTQQTAPAARGKAQAPTAQGSAAQPGAASAAGSPEASKS